MIKLEHSQTVSKPVLREPIQRERLILLLADALNQLFPLATRKQAKGEWGKGAPRYKSLRRAQVRYNAFRSSISEFERFLTTKAIAVVQIDEKLILDFEAHLKENSTPRSYIGNHRNQIRKLINLLPADILNREIGTMARFHQAHRWDGFSSETPEILNQFLKNGRKLRRRTYRQAPALTSIMLSIPYREQVVRETITFLKVIRATDILKITPADVEDFIEIYEENDKRQTALGILDYIHPLFNNLLCQGKISADPLADVPRKTTRQNLDYVPQDGMDKLADLTTVDMNDFMDVRDRLICFSLYYDFALRNREGALLKVSALNLNGHTCVNLPKEVQKVQREDSLLFSYFPEVTRPLIERYLELRARKNPSTDILIVADDGKPLQADGCRLALKAHCDRLGVKTYEGKTPTPHRFRHSFGTLNIFPLGKRLQITQVRDQYRHSSLETTDHLYIGKNNILKTRAYEEWMRMNGNGNGLHPNGTGLVPASPIASTPSVAQTASTPIPAVPSDNVISEEEAVRMVRRLGVDYRALRAFGLMAGKVFKNGRGYDYSHSFIADLADNYLTAREAMDLLKKPKSSFFHWRKTEGIEVIQIGQIGLYRQDLILQKRRAG